MAHPATYERRLNLLDAAMVVIGGTIGGGIFLNPAVVAQRAHTATFVLLTWIIGGAIAVAGALCYAELGARRPQAGGGYVYLREMWGPLPAFLYGWMFLWVVNTGGIAAVAVTFARYFADLAHLPVRDVIPIAIGAIVLLSFVNYLGIRAGAVTQNIFTVLKLIALAALICAGIFFVHLAMPSVSPVPPLTPIPSGDVVRVLGTALIPVLFAYGGWAHLNNVAGEIRNPERTIPRAIIIGIFVVMTVYVLANVAYLRTLGAAGLAASTAPASETMRAIFGATGGTLIGMGVVASTFGFVNLSILSAPRILQQMAHDGLFFKRAAVLHPKYRTPHVAIWVQAVWAIALVLSGTYGQLLDYVVFGDWLFAAAVVVTVFAYRRADVARAMSGNDGEPRGYRVPGYPVVPICFIIVSLYVVVSTVISAPRNAMYGAIIILAGVPAFYAWQRRVTRVVDVAG